ncbi:TonB-dependent receptor domain-containing protein, partial [Serratia marcescens]|uniref:TonB-dependent receptor domain-containing protein n=1 Tax=Serratia marcescens TaxID=615 RepID=UPI0028143144
TSYYSNAGKASSKGAEVSFSLRPARGFVVDGNLSYIDATLGRSLPLPTVGIKGDALPFTPRWSGQVSAEYQFSLGDAWTATAGSDFRYVGNR